MFSSITISLAFLTLVHCISTATAEGCIGSFAALQTLELARGNNTAIPATYVICPNTVFNFTGTFDALVLNGNSNYLCGEDGSLENNCTVSGGDVHFIIDIISYDFSNKDNILLSGFTFEKAELLNAVISNHGRFTIRDCVFKDNINLSVLAMPFSIDPEIRQNNRALTTKNTEGDENERSLLIGGGSEPRITLLLDRVQFLNNSLTKNVFEPSIGNNGPLAVNTAFADVTLSQCLFKDNVFGPSRELNSFGFGIRVDPSSTVNISNTCFVNEFYQSGGPLWIRADSGLISSQNNYVSATPLDNRGNPISPCQYMFLEESYECVAPESNVCDLPACAASYKLYNARTDRFVTDILSGGTIASPPCDLNIEAVLPCATTGKNVSVQLLRANGSVVKKLDQVVPFFLFGNNGTNVFAGRLAPGTYKIQAVANGIVQPSPITFTLAGRCARS